MKICEGWNSGSNFDNALEQKNYVHANAKTSSQQSGMKIRLHQFWLNSCRAEILLKHFFLEAGWEIRLRNSRIASSFWKTLNQNYHFSRKLQINFFWRLDIFFFRIALLTPSTAVPTNHTFHKGRLLKRHCYLKLKLSKAKSFFSRIMWTQKETQGK